jgi:hypothetical protein
MRRKNITSVNRKGLALAADEGVAELDLAAVGNALQPHFNVANGSAAGGGEEWLAFPGGPGTESAAVAGAGTPVAIEGPLQLGAIDVETFVLARSRGMTLHLQ